MGVNFMGVCRGMARNGQEGYFLRLIWAVLALRHARKNAENG
jgi:hypothetical protein